MVDRRWLITPQLRPALPAAARPLPAPPLGSHNPQIINEIVLSADRTQTAPNERARALGIAASLMSETFRPKMLK